MITIYQIAICNRNLQNVINFFSYVK